MFLLALDLIILARAEIIHFTYCQYSDSSCSDDEPLCTDVCDSNALCATSSCDYYESVYTSGGMTEYGECYANGGSYYLANCTDIEESSEEPSRCADFDICEVSCQTRNGGCGSGCYFTGRYVTNSTDYSCDHMRQYFKTVYDEFETFDKCFNNTAVYASGQDYYLICNMDGESTGSDEDAWYIRVLVPLASIGAVYCCIWIVWRQSQAAGEKYRSGEKSATGTTEPI